MLEDLTQKQIEVLLYIKSEVQKKGYPPSVREICKGVNIKSTSTVHGHLATLESKGYIRKDPTKPRAIEVLDRNEDYLLASKRTVDVPILSRVTAGKPILSLENIEDTYPIPADLVEEHNVFMLKIQDKSMIDVGILKGDLVLVQEQEWATNGDIVVVLLDKQFTVKRYFKDQDMIRLEAENQLIETIFTEEVLVLGKVIGLYRKI